MEVQNRELYLQHMNDEYRRKHYPEGSGGLWPIRRRRKGSMRA